jgi:hypothetical protein
MTRGGVAVKLRGDPRRGSPAIATSGPHRRSGFEPATGSPEAPSNQRLAHFLHAICRTAIRAKTESVFNAIRISRVGMTLSGRETDSINC